jgi:hypothetical protein
MSANSKNQLPECLWDTTSVADIPDPAFYPSQIPDPGSWISDTGSRIQQQHQKLFCPTIFCHKYHKIVNNFSFEQVKEIFGDKTIEIIVCFTQKSVNKLSKISVWGTMNRIADLQHWTQHRF